jgi:hypothetical protein
MNEKATHKAVYPSVPIKDFKWTSGADVQTTWRKHGWAPPSEKMTPPPPPKQEAPAFVPTLRRFK